VYRGCADSRNLPLGVDSSVQCRKQGRLPAVWWFCNGTLCNSGQFSTVCSADSKNGNSGLLIQFVALASLLHRATLKTHGICLTECVEILTKKMKTSWSGLEIQEMKEIHKKKHEIPWTATVL